MRAYVVMVGRGVPVVGGRGASGPARIAETGRALVIHSRYPRTGSVVLELADLSDRVLVILRAFTGGR